ncbi:aldo/keto reductase [Acephala macrosclerotiorum]|nr:aldo/keto reductase [Acephala macrosclerotiorum]
MFPQKLPTRQLGKDGPQVPQLGFGLMELSIGYGATPLPDSERFAVLDRAWSLGATFWDTAAGYGDNEILIGKWFALHPERRNDIFLGTKFGGKAVRDENGKVRIEIDSSKENCRAVCEQSLKNLGIECLDLFYVHRFDSVTPVEKTMEALVELKREGKIKHIGFSECSSDTLRRGYAIHPIAAVQIEYNPWTLDIESEAGTNLLSTCRELGVAMVTYSPLGRGFMTGRYKSLNDFDENDTRRQLPRFSPENFSKNLDLVKIFEDLATKKGCTPAQVILAWIMAQGPDFFPIPGTKTIKYLEQNLGAVDVNISDEENKSIRDAVEAVGGAVGHRNVASGNMFADILPL